MASIRPHGRRGHLLGNARIRTRRKRLLRKAVRRAERPVRSPDHPVRVTFVCEFGGTSGVRAREFSRFLRSHKISSVQSSNVQLFLPDGFSDKPYAVRKTTQMLRQELADSDIVFLGPKDFASGFGALHCPKARVFMNQFGLLDARYEFKPILKTIQTYFRLTES